MNTSKTIEVYKRDEENPNKTYNLEFIKDYDISNISIKELKSIIIPIDDDVNLFLMYTLNVFQLTKIQELSNVFFDIDDNKYIYMFSQYST
ncbi:hypothetical protein [Chryseobacterium sp.]|uniref:DUF7683 domain-containing protein n=1 Tax=Chryseobacterium sp. TaxID=1871047 RepID=UPI00289BCB3B|nr:hypothetical protein [Chryseobacterium sp.]